LFDNDSLRILACLLTVTYRAQAGESAFKAILAPVHMGDIFGADMCIRRPLAVRERLNPDAGPQPAPPTVGTILRNVKHPDKHTRLCHRPIAAQLSKILHAEHDLNSRMFRADTCELI